MLDEKKKSKQSSSESESSLPDSHTQNVALHIVGGVVFVHLATGTETQRRPVGQFQRRRPLWLHRTSRPSKPSAGNVAAPA